MHLKEKKKKYHKIHNLYLYLGYELPLCKVYTNISTNMDSTNIFPFLAIFAQNFTILPQNS